MLEKQVEAARLFGHRPCKRLLRGTVEVSIILEIPSCSCCSSILDSAAGFNVSLAARTSLRGENIFLYSFVRAVVPFSFPVCSWRKTSRILRDI